MRLGQDRRKFLLCDVGACVLLPLIAHYISPISQMDELQMTIAAYGILLFAVGFTMLVRTCMQITQSVFSYDRMRHDNNPYQSPSDF